MTFVKFGGENGDFPIIPKIIAFVPTSNMRNFGEFIPKNPQKFSSFSPWIFSKDSKNPFPVLTLSPNFGDGMGIFEFWGPTWTPYYPL